MHHLDWHVPTLSGAHPVGGLRIVTIRAALQMVLGNLSATDSWPLHPSLDDLSSSGPIWPQTQR